MMLIKPKELERPQIEEALSEIMNKPLGIVAAPSGYGKTTVVRAFLQKNTESKNVWLSLGHEEVDEVWVWNRICDKFKEVNIELYEQMMEMGLPATSQTTDLFIRTIRKHLKQPFCLVIDDYHECRSAVIDKLLTRLVYENIPLLHIILVGRIYPEIPFEEMFLKGYCVVIDQKALVLTKEESRRVFEINGVQMSEEDFGRMEEYTDGWISAVYLFLFEYSKNKRFGHYLSVVHLLKTAIYDKLPETLQALCMKMSLFGHFTLEEAVYVSEYDIPFTAMMDMIERFGFMQYDSFTEKYEMHALLQSVASVELEKSGIDKKTLYRRGAEWNEKNGNRVDAVVYYRKAGDIERIFEMLTADSLNSVLENAPGIFMDLIEETSLDILLKYPKVYLSYVYYVIEKVDALKGSELLKEIRVKYEELMKDDEKYDELLGEILIVQTVAEFNEMGKMTELMKKALELRKSQASQFFRKNLFTYGSPQMTMLYHNRVGELEKVIGLEKQYSRYYMQLISGIDGDWDNLFDAEYSFLTGDIDKAYELAGQVQEKSKVRKQTCVTISSYYLQLRCQIYKGKVKEFERKMNELHEEMKNVVRPMLVTDYEITYSNAYALIGKVDKMAPWVKNFELDKCSRIVRSIRIGCITYGTLLCKRNEWTGLDAIAEQLLVPFERAKHIYAMLCGYLYKAIAAFHQKGLSKAGEYLVKALELAEPDEIRLPFIERSEELAPIVEAFEYKSKFLQSLKPHFKQYRHSLKLFSKEAEKIALTKREQELMELVKNGYRNGEISEKMNIALVTVEKNLTNIYRKLNVSNRAGAIARLKEIY